jgi:hypothetical protein
MTPANRFVGGAAQGCTMLGRKSTPAEAALLPRLADPSGAVQIAAAEALAALGRIDAALPVLERWIADSNTPAFILQAGNVLDRLGERARPALAAMKRAVASSPAANRRHLPSATHSAAHNRRASRNDPVPRLSPKLRITRFWEGMNVHTSARQFRWFTYGSRFKRPYHGIRTRWAVSCKSRWFEPTK